jgi:fimbrial chaperone protein
MKGTELLAAGTGFCHTLQEVRSMKSTLQTTLRSYLFTPMVLKPLQAFRSCPKEHRSVIAFQVEPVEQVFAPTGEQATHTYKVTNCQNKRVAVEFYGVKRFIDLDGEETDELAQEDLLIYPPQLVLEPGTTHLVHVKWVGDPAPQQEIALRLVAEQVPLHCVDPTQPNPLPVPGRKPLLIRHVSSLYVRPIGARAAVDLESVEVDTEVPENPTMVLTFVNSGRASAQLHGLNLSVMVNTQSVSLTPGQLRGITDTTILAGHRRCYRLPLPKALPLGSTPTVTFTYCQKPPDSQLSRTCLGREGLERCTHCHARI